VARSPRFCYISRALCRDCTFKGGEGEQRLWSCLAFWLTSNVLSTHFPFDSIAQAREDAPLCIIFAPQIPRVASLWGSSSVQAIIQPYQPAYIYRYSLSHRYTSTHDFTSLSCTFGCLAELQACPLSSCFHPVKALCLSYTARQLAGSKLSSATLHRLSTD